MCRRVPNCEVSHYPNSSTPKSSPIYFILTLPSIPFSLTNTIYENVFGDATLWSLVHFYQRFRRSCCLHRRSTCLWRKVVTLKS